MFDPSRGIPSLSNTILTPFGAYMLAGFSSWLHPVFLFATTLTPLAALSSFWLTNRYELIGTALVFLLIGWLQLRNTDALLQKPGGEEERRDIGDYLFPRQGPRAPAGDFVPCPPIT